MCFYCDWVSCYKVNENSLYNVYTGGQVANNSSNKDIYYSGRFWVLLGVALLLSSELFFYRESYKFIVSNLLLQLGLAFIIMGIVSILLQIEDVKLYFQERLKEIVVQRSYLQNLTDDELTSIQVDTLKAKYKNTDIDRDGSFLYYFQNKIQDYIGFPYRENVCSSVLIEEDTDNDDCFKVYDTTTYTCRSNGDRLQDEVRWIYEENEFDAIHDVRLVIGCPVKNQLECAATCADKMECDNGIIQMDKTLLDDKHKVDSRIEKGYKVSIKGRMLAVDKLQIDLVTCYSIKRSNIFTWSMTNPSKGINFTITYPGNYRLNHFVGGIEPREYSSSNNGNMYIFRHEGWFLPRTGIAWNLVKV